MKDLGLPPFQSPHFYILSVFILLGAQWILPMPQDIHTFYVWMQLGFEKGILQIYQWSPAEVLEKHQEFSVNYPPLILFLYPFAWILHWLSVWPEWPSPFANLFFRLPLLLGHFFICLSLFKKRVNPNEKSQRLIWIFLFLLNPAFLVAGPVWGQLNFLLWGFIALSMIYWEDGKTGLSAFFAVLGALTKPQFIMFLPALALLLITYGNLKKCTRWGVCFLLILMGMISPWFVTQGWECLRAGYLRVSQNQYSIADIGYGLWWTLSNTFNIDLNQIRLGKLGAQSLAILIPNTVIGLLGGSRLLRRRSFHWEEFSAFSLLLLFCLLPGMNAQCLIFGTAFVCLVALKRPSQVFWAIGASLIQIYQLAYNAVWVPRTRLYLAIPTEVAKALGALCFLLVVTLAIYFATNRSSEASR